MYHAPNTIPICYIFKVRHRINACTKCYLPWPIVICPRGSQGRSFLHEVDFGHNVTIEVHCPTFEWNPSTFGWDMGHTRFWKEYFKPIFSYFCHHFGTILHLYEKFWSAVRPPTPQMRYFSATNFYFKCMFPRVPHVSDFSADSLLYLPEKMLSAMHSH